MKQAGTLLIVLSILAGVGYVAYVQLISGATVSSHRLEPGSSPTVVQVALAPEQSPVRLLLSIRYRRSALGLSRIGYDVTFKSGAGEVLWTQKGSVGGSSVLQIGSKRRRRINRSRYGSTTESVRVFDVPEKGTYTVECALTESTGSFDSGKLTFRANVKRVSPGMLALCAGPGTVLGLLLFGLSFRKAGNAGGPGVGEEEMPEIEVGPDDAA